MAKRTWDKVVHAAPTIDHRLTQDDWHHINRTTQPAPPPEPGAGYEPRYYNPSGPFYTTVKPPPVATAKKEAK